MEFLSLTTNTPVPEILLRFGLAALLGMVLGIDREIRGKPAGLRTHMLIALGAAVTTVVGFELYYSAIEIHQQSRSDLLRIIEGVMAAIGFLGAGAIISRDRSVHNMTTAANIWVCGAIGIACGAGYYIIAVIALGFTIAILTVLGLIERMIKRSID
ncbi:MAG TPA: MgtC/SapB family protein [Alphaproteobacteria bacterium]|nr:MgtC/SapB family protein [Alphaproteobacteria bacterium]